MLRSLADLLHRLSSWLPLSAGRRFGFSPAQPFFRCSPHILRPLTMSCVCRNSFSFAHPSFNISAAPPPTTLSRHLPPGLSIPQLAAETFQHTSPQEFLPNLSNNLLRTNTSPLEQRFTSTADRADQRDRTYILPFPRSPSAPHQPRSTPP